MKIRALVPFWSHIFLPFLSLACWSHTGFLLTVPLTGQTCSRLRELHLLLPFFFFEAESTKKIFQLGYSSVPSPLRLPEIFKFQIQMLPAIFSEASPYGLCKIAPLSPAIPNLPSLLFLCSTYHHLTYYVFCFLAHVSPMKVRHVVYFVLIRNPCA